MKILRSSIAIISLIALLLGASNKITFVPKDGYVPNSATAIRIAEAVWIPIYGEKEIHNSKPFKAVLNNGIWTVEGSLPKGNFGGVPLAEIAKRDGRILRVIHGK